MSGRLVTWFALVGVTGLVACSSATPKPIDNAAGAHVLLVGTYKGHAGRYATIQAAVDAAKPGDWVLIAPGDYHERYDRSVPVGEHTSSGVWVARPGVRIRGMDRNAVVIDGTKPGAPRCSTRAGDQDFGRVDAKGKPVGRNGLEVWKASGGSIENLTVCNFLSGSQGGGNQIWWNGGDGSGTIGLHAYNGSYLSATTTYAGAGGDGSYGIFVSNSDGPGVVAHSYASNMSDSGYYIGACRDCNATLDDAHAQYSALGYSGTNSGGHLLVQNSEFDHNKTGFATNSQNNDDAPSPQDGACPSRGIGPTGTRSCWIFQHNFVHDNNTPNVPGRGTADLGPPGTGLVISGGRNNTVIDNRFENNGSWAVLVVPFPDTDTPPPIAHCQGGDPNGVPGLGIKGCYFDTWGNDIAHNTFKNNGGFGNPTNGDLAELSARHTPGNCWHENVDTAGVTSAPPRLQETNGICGVAHAGAQLGSTLTAQVICATEVFGPCPPKRGTAYPRRAKVVLPALTPQLSMPNPCAGVPDNSWCTKSGPIAATILPLPLLGLAQPLRRYRITPLPVTSGTSSTESRPGGAAHTVGMAFTSRPAVPMTPGSP
jgi:Periplasmic copper-binding protein (NosD)